MKHRFHVVGFPHTQTTRAFTSCAYTEKVRKFCTMMLAQGNEVILYSGEHNEAPCTEHVPLVSDKFRVKWLKGRHYTEASFDPTLPQWIKFNTSAGLAILDRASPRDVVCLTGGTSHRRVADLTPKLTHVEYGVGYGGVFTNHRVFESYAWMHAVYGAHAPGGDPHRIDGHWFDAVIHGAIDEADFPPGTGGGDDNGQYALYLGRMIDRKGIHVAREAAAAARVRLITAGPGNGLPGIEHRGEVGPEARAGLLGRATALLMPTIYCEPFGNVAIEAMACGTPVISTDWGAMTETVRHGETGFRCRSLQQFVDALRAAPSLDRERVRRYAIDHFGLDEIGRQYQDYFSHLSTLWGRGWYQLRGEEKVS